MNEKNFGFLDINFQQVLIKVLIEDKKYSATIVELIETEYFDNAYFRFIVQNIKELYTEFGWISSYDTLANKLMIEGTNNTSRTVHLDTLKAIKELEISEDRIQYVKKVAMNFCKQQVMKKTIKVVEKIIENGKFDEYDTIEKIIQEALQIGTATDDVVDAFYNIEAVLEKDGRVPIPLGVSGLDNLLKGGLAIGELGVVLAPTGIGKTTLLTLFANTAYNCGKNVLHIFFEDNLTNILQKHYTLWTGISSDYQIERKAEVISLVKEREKSSPGQLKLLKMPSDSVTISEIKSRLRKLAIEGFRPDLVVIDYVDCITPEKAPFGEEWKGEGNIMRHLEAMTSEFNIAIWVATQGNRDSISSEVVMTDQMGGSIKKAQIGHVVLSIGKTLMQKEHNLGTLTLLKSRIGKDGIVFQNCIFDNEYLLIDTENQNTILGHKEEEQEKKRERIQEVYRERHAKQAEITQIIPTATEVPPPALKENTNFDKPVDPALAFNRGAEAYRLSQKNKTKPE